MTTVTRVGALTLAIVLAAGFAYSGAATVSHLRHVFQQAEAVGPSSTVDSLLTPVNLSSDQLRGAVCSFFPPDEDIVFVGESPLTPQEITQIYYVVSYLSQPRRILLGLRGSNSTSGLIVAGR